MCVLGSVCLSIQIVPDPTVTSIFIDRYQNILQNCSFELVDVSFAGFIRVGERSRSHT